jgi:hypothetical protein
MQRNILCKSFALLSGTTEFVDGIVNDWTDIKVATERQTGRTEFAVLDAF